MLHVTNFARSAMAPVMSAGVMTANISWNTDEDQERDAGTAPPLLATFVRPVAEPDG